jgi:hypothetical protein
MGGRGAPRTAQAAKSGDPPCCVRSGCVVNTEPHTGARPSVRVCGGANKNYRESEGGTRKTKQEPHCSVCSLFCC